jgi:opacity protein-like surface antigen
MKRSVIVCASALALMSASSAVAQKQGDWVLAQWLGGSGWYPGVVEGRAGNQVSILYDDGSRETRPINQVRPYNWRVGTRIVCRFTDGKWYDATITGMNADGTTIRVRYDDGIGQLTQTGRCRVD